MTASFARAASAFAFFFGCAWGSAQAQPDAEPTPPAGATLVREVQAGGAQVYAVGEQADARAGLKLRAPRGG